MLRQSWEGIWSDRNGQLVIELVFLWAPRTGEIVHFTMVTRILERSKPRALDILENTFKFGIRGDSNKKQSFVEEYEKAPSGRKDFQKSLKVIKNLVNYEQIFQFCWPLKRHRLNDLNIPTHTKSELKRNEMNFFFHNILVYNFMILNDLKI